MGRSDEEKQIAKLVSLNVARLLRDKGKIRRVQHRKHHGCVEALFRISTEAPKNVRAGIFERSYTFRALVRFSNGRVQDDRQADAHGMAIKLLDVPGAKLISGREHETAQDFVLVDSETFFTGDPDEYAHVNRAIMGNGFAWFRGWVALLLRPKLLFRLRKFASKQPRSLLETAYFSATPFRLGGEVVKYAVIPRARQIAPPLSGPDGLAISLREHLDVTDAVFDFYVDIQTDAARQPVDDPTQNWRSEGALRARVAELIIPKQYVEAQSSLAENLQFSPWHSLPTHEPLGYINRARSPIYREMGRFRHVLNGIIPLESSEAPIGFVQPNPISVETE